MLVLAYNKGKLIPCIMEIGTKISRAELTKLGWNRVKEMAKASCEIWAKGTENLIWRIKTEVVYLYWDSKMPRK
jgi:hypothetical protein